MINVKNIVYFAENDVNGFSREVYRFITANKDSFDAKTGKSLKERTLWNADGFNCRLNLKEFEKLVLSPDFIQAFLSEISARNDTNEHVKERYMEQLRRYSALVFAEMEKIYQEIGFDIYICISNPKLSIQDKSFVNNTSFAKDIVISQKTARHFSYDYFAFLIDTAI